jgi:hypothetical protein
MFAELGRFGHHGDVYIDDAEAITLQQLEDMAHELPAVRTTPARVGIRKVHANVTESSGAEQGIAKRVQHDIAIGMRANALSVRDRDAAERHMIARFEGMYVVSLANTQSRHEP